ncbi:glutaredoxin 3 [Methylopila henanensis]|uniref:Glutaredoxin n=1 Tax=Methylopila henanensis TaxID=873516 RepID=A0ABW4KCL1_9HYPH
MPPVTVYARVGCPYCDMAKDLLARKNIPFEEIDIGRQPARRPEMIQRAGGRSTVPQIFIGDRHVGGCDDLYALEQAGGLDPLLAA